MANDLKRGIRVYLETSDYGKGMEQMSAATKKYESDLQGLTEQSKKMTAAGENSGKAWDDLQKQIKRTGDQVKKSQTTEADYAAKLKQTEKVLNNLSGSSYNELIEVQKKLQKEVKKGSDTVEEQNNKLNQLQRVNGQVAHSYAEMNSKIGAGSKGISGFIDNMSNMPGIVGMVGSSLQGLGAGLKALFLNPVMLIIGAVAALGMAVYALVKNSMEFSKAMSQLSAITGATGDDLLYLKQKAKDLAAQYGKSAVEIVEAMKLVGSAKPELLSNVEALSAMTESVLVLSKATGMDLSASTASVTTIMNQFSMVATDANKTINILAAGSKFGAVEVDYLSESIVKVGSIAKSAGLSLEQTVSVMELFGEKGIKAEVAGTGFKSILGKLQSETKNYTNGLFDLNKAIDNNQSISNSNLELQKKFGAEFYGLAGILLQNKERFQELTKQVTNTQTAFDQMRIANDNLSGDVNGLKGAWDRLLLSIEDGDGVFARASRYIVKFFTGLVNDITLLGKDFGSFISFIQESFQYLGLQILSAGSVIGLSFSALGEMARKAVEGDFKGMKDVFTDFKKDVADAWNPKRWDAIVQNTRNIKANELAMRAKMKADKEAAEAKAKLDSQQKGKGKTTVELSEEEKNKIAEQQRKLTAAQKKKLDDAMQALENENLAKVTEIKQKYIDGDIKTEFEYNQKLLKQQDVYDEKRKAKLQELLKTVTNPSLRLEIEKQVAEIDKKDIDRQIDHLNKIKKILLDTDPAKAENLSYDDRLRELGLFGLKREEMTADQLAVLKILEEQHTKTIKDINDKYDNENLKALKDIETAGTTALDTGEKTKLLLLKSALSKRKITQSQYDLAEKKQLVDTANAKLALAEVNLKAIESAEFKSEANRTAAINEAKAKIEELKNGVISAEIELTNVTKKVGKDIASEMNSIFGSTFSGLSGLFTNFYNGLDKLKSGDLKSWSDWASAIGGIVNSALSVASEANDQYYQMKGAELEADKQRELTAAGDNAAEKDRINQEYAQKELDLKKEQSSADTKLKIAQAVAAGGLAIVQAYAQLGPIGGTIAAIMIAGITKIQIDTITKQNAAIQATTLDSSSGSSDSGTTTGSRVVTPQAAEGRWDVVGADDGRTYMNVPYRGVARTGIVTRPTLMGERGDELIVDNPTLRNIRMNEPWLINRIKHYRVQQRAGGNYSAVDNNATGGGSSPAYDNTAMLNALDRMIAFLQYLIENGVKAPIVLSELEAKIALRDKSLKKGSI